MFTNPEGKKFCMKLFFLEAMNPLQSMIFLKSNISYAFLKFYRNFFQKLSFFEPHEQKGTPPRHASYTTTPVLLKAGGKPSTWFPPGGLVEHALVNQKRNMKKTKGKNTRKTKKQTKQTMQMKQTKYTNKEHKG